MNELRKLIHRSRASSVVHFRSFFQTFLIGILEETIVILTQILRCSAQFLEANPRLAYLLGASPLPSTYLLTANNRWSPTIRRLAYIAIFSNKGSAEHRQWFCKKLWNKQFLKYGGKNSQTYLETSR